MPADVSVGTSVGRHPGRLLEDRLDGVAVWEYKNQALWMGDLCGTIPRGNLCGNNRPVVKPQCDRER